LGHGSRAEGAKTGRPLNQLQRWPSIDVVEKKTSNQTHTASTDAIRPNTN
jgi:hypothetical protein